MIRFRSAALACSLALTSFSVLAAASSSATFSNIQFQLTDLTPGDAQQSGFSFSMPASYYFSGNDVDTGASGFESNWWSPSDSYFTGQDSFALGEEAGRVQWGNAAAGYRVDASSIGVFGQAHGFQTSYSSLMNDKSGIKALGQIEVAPHSELRISVDALVMASATNPLGSLWGSHMDVATAHADFELAYFVPGPWSSVLYSDSLYAYADAITDTRIIDRLEWVESEGGQGQYIYEWHIAPGHEQVMRMQKTFQGVISNTTDSMITATLYLGLNVQGSGFSAPVPEPSGVLLVLPGLALMAARARRRPRG